VTLSSFGFESCGNETSVEAGKTGTMQQQQQTVKTIPPAPQDDAILRSQPFLEGNATKDNVLWTLKFITSHYSFDSSKRSKRRRELFRE